MEASSGAPARKSFLLHHPDESDGEQVRGVEIEKIENSRVPVPVPTRGDHLVRKLCDEPKEARCLCDGNLFARREIELRVLFPARMGTDADEPPTGLQNVVDG